LAGLPLSVRLGIEHLAQDTTYSTTGVSADLLLAAGRGFRFSLGVGRERTALMGVLPGATTKRSRLAIRAGARMDLRDNPVAPRNGLLLRAEGDWGSRRDGGVGIEADKSVDLARLQVGSEIYRPVHGRHGVFVGARWSKIFSDESPVPVDQTLRFGGAGSLRGYREDQFRAEETGLVQIEHRIAMGERGSRLFFFADFGMLRGEKAPDGTLIGYGLGLRAATRGGVVGLDFALGRGDSWREAKVHVKLERFF
jgi:outer membrane protein assembly factor BamA